MAPARPVAQPAASPDICFRVRLLGPFSVQRDGVGLDAAHWQPRVARLFRLLASAPGQRCQREQVIEVFWPDSSLDAGGAALRLLCHRLRRTLDVADPPAVVLSNGWVALHPAYRWDIDLDRFERAASAAVDTATLEAAAQLYGGQPLDDDRYEDWATPLCGRVQRHWRGVCLRLGERYEAAGAWDRAAGCYHQILDADPFDEAALQRLLTALTRSGRQTEMLRVYQRFHRQLEDEVGVAPAEETTEIVERLWSQTPAIPGILLVVEMVGGETGVLNRIAQLARANGLLTLTGSPLPRT